MQKPIVQGTTTVWKLNIKKLGPLVGLLLLCIVLTFLSDSFFTLDNWLNILRQVSINALIAFGMTFVILTGGIDLSVGSVLALSSAFAAGLMANGMNGVFAMMIGISAGLAMGALNGVIITKCAACLSRPDKLERFKSKELYHIRKQQRGTER